ncbi:hypothetical protein ACVWY2_003657 [Bradyrhizobium sp. JR6.1]
MIELGDDVVARDGGLRLSRGERHRKQNQRAEHGQKAEIAQASRRQAHH